MAKKIAVCLSGCGLFDGAEIHESVCTLLALDRAGAKIICCAPNIPQTSVIDHLAQAPAAGEKRNVLVESARIARGEISDLAKVKAQDIDALIFPGGFGAAKNLCSFAADGPECSVNPQVERLVGEMIDAGKVVGAMCIAPALLARIYGKRGLKPVLTIGNDPGTAKALVAMGAQHKDCPVTEAVIDESLKVVTTPAYMLGPGPAAISQGIEKLVQAVMQLA